MTIPLGANFASFYLEARKKGIKITSRYLGVSVLNDKQYGIRWHAWAKNKNERLQKTFPFTELGEYQAHQWHERNHTKL